MRFSPRQADLMIVAGRVGIKMMPVLQRIYQQMCEPKGGVSMGACASTGGVFDNYATIQGIDQFIPVDVYVPGCPPRPEALLEGLMRIQDKIKGHKMWKQPGQGGLGQLGTKIDDELPIPHHSGYVTATEDEPVYDHQKITG